MKDQLSRLKEHFGELLCDSTPLFPNVEGKVVSKLAVAEALEATVSGYGDAIRGHNGGKLLGGHSFRVTGAQLLAALGGAVVKIMVLA